MVIPAVGGFALAAGAGAGAGSSSSWLSGLGGALGGPIGGILGGLAGGLLGGSSGGGFHRALRRSLSASTLSLERGVQNFEDYGGRFLDAFRSASPVYGALEDRALSDMNDTTRTARLESAFQRQIGSQQAARGLYRSPSAALQSSFMGLQFQEQIRQQAFQNAMGFQQSLGQPLATGIFQAGMPNIQGDIGFQQQAFDYGAGQAQNQSIANGLSQGFNAGIGFASRGNQNQSFIQQAIERVFGGN